MLLLPHKGVEANLQSILSVNTNGRMGRMCGCQRVDRGTDIGRAEKRR